MMVVMVVVMHMIVKMITVFRLWRKECAIGALVAIR